MTRLPRALAAVLIAALAVPAAAAAPKRAAAPAASDWGQVATRTPEGNFVQGNPRAKVRLVEYLSFTCPHCAVFEAEAAAPLLQRYIRTGRVSYEVRVALRDPFDLAAAVLARCNGPRAFFAVKPALYAAQSDWLAKSEAWGATAPNLEAMPPGDAARAVAAGAGLDGFFLRHGLSRARIDACLANVAEQQALSTAAEKIWQPGFPGTPMFVIDGVPAKDTHGWADVEAKLRAALG